ncbi:MAG: GNAT family N-acetyltransferase [Vagococcus sp.]|uniref:GNAT family N-acetyltransferase n=1 Tax=Vagococcus sp. TaxID=1933889 RepID=UPI002FC96EFC
MIKIKNGTTENLDELIELFDQYRQFYKQNSDKKQAKSFLSERLNNQDSMIYIAYLNDKPVGFTQLFPSFSSVSMEKMWILNDLYIAPSARKKGIADELMKTAINFSKETNSKGLRLETSSDNYPAQQLYEKIGFKRETEYFYFYSTK